MNIRRPLLQGFSDNLVHELNDGSLGIVLIQNRRLLLKIIGRGKFPSGFQNFIECLGPYSVPPTQAVQHRPPRSHHPTGFPSPKTGQRLPRQVIKRIKTKNRQGLPFHRRHREKPMPQGNPGGKLFPQGCRNRWNLPLPNGQPQGFTQFLRKNLFVHLPGFEQRVDHRLLFSGSLHDRLLTDRKIFCPRLLRQFDQSSRETHRDKTFANRSGLSPARSFRTNLPSSRTSFPSKKIRPPPCARDCRLTRSQ